MDFSYLTHTLDDKVKLTEDAGDTTVVPTPPVAVLRSRMDEYFVAYQSGIGLTLNFARSRDAGQTWEKVED